jgi:hypothetical protein
MPVVKTTASRPVTSIIPRPPASRERRCRIRPALATQWLAFLSRASLPLLTARNQRLPNFTGGAPRQPERKLRRETAVQDQADHGWGLHTRALLRRQSTPRSERTRPHRLAQTEGQPTDVAEPESSIFSHPASRFISRYPPLDLGRASMGRGPCKEGIATRPVRRAGPPPCVMRLRPGRLLTFGGPLCTSLRP